MTSDEDFVFAMPRDLRAISLIIAFTQSRIEIRLLTTQGYLLLLILMMEGRVRGIRCWRLWSA